MDKVVDISVPSLVVDLCKLTLGQHSKVNLIQPKFSHSDKIKKLKSKAWSTLMGQLKGPFCIKLPRNQFGLSEVDEIYTYSYRLRTKHQFDDASRLENLVETFMQESAPRDAKCAVLRFLLELADSGNTSKKNVNGIQIEVPLATAGHKDIPILPNGPLQYGDTRFQVVSRWYKHFPSHIFKMPDIDMRDVETAFGPNLIQIFKATPGSYLPWLFQTKGCLEDEYEHTSCSTLYGALTQSTTSSIEIRLSIPDLSDSGRPPEFKIPNIFETPNRECSESLSSPSSGYATPCDSGLGSAEADVTGADTEIWQRALEYTPSKHRVWENRGRVPGPTEKAYLSEAGAKALDNLWAVHISHLKLIDPSIQIPVRQFVGMEHLVADVINLLIGIPSTSFFLDKTSNEFHICPGLCVSGMTPEALARACQGAMDCGTDYHRLAAFSQSVKMNSFYNSGLIFQAFTVAVGRYLHHYRASVLSISAGQTLMSMNAILHKVYRQMRFLAKLCHCVVPSDGGVDQDEPFPTGVGLLSYLYKHTLETDGSDFYPMMLSLFAASCGPYLLFVQDWVFCGICHDKYGEFMIQINDDYLRYRDKYYWTKGYVMITDDRESSVPLFLSEFANDIFICGKSINLLRLCYREHFLLNVDHEVPRIMITFSEEEVQRTKVHCQAYFSRMQQMARMKSISRQQMIERAEQAKQDLIIQARKVAAEQLAQIQAKAQKRRETEDAKKRQLFTKLKKQMEDDLRRRASQQEQEKEEDMARAKEASKGQLLEVQAAEELEKQAREELIDYYSKLSAEAALREQRAMWKVRRSQLDEARREFLLKEEAKLAIEMQQLMVNKDGQAAADSSREPPSSLEVAKWTEVVPDPSQFLSEPNGLPGWAREGLKTAPPGLDVSITENMPNWAKKAIDGENVEPAMTALHEQSKETTTDTSIQKENQGREKQHPSNSSVGDIMKAEPVVKPQLEGVRHIGIQRAERPKYSHPSASTIQDLIYVEPVQKATSESQNKIKASNVDGDISSDKCIAAERSIEMTQENGTTTDTEVNATQTQVDSKGVEAQSQNSTASDLGHPSADDIKSSLSTEEPPAVIAQEGIDVLTQFKSATENYSTRQIQGKHVNDQSEEVKSKLHTKMSAVANATAESEEKEYKPHLKTVKSQNSTTETEPKEVKPQIKYNKDRNVTMQSVGEVVKVKPRNMFGHVSDLSRGEYVFEAPRLKRHIPNISLVESDDWKTFQVKPHQQRKIRDGITKESSGESQYRPHIRTNPTHHASVESDYVDVDKQRLERHRQINTKGHASDSTIQHLLYGPKHVPEDAEQNDDDDMNLELEKIDLITDIKVEPYKEQFDFDSAPGIDLLAQLGHPVHGMLDDWGRTPKPNVSAFKHVPLPALLKYSVTTPLNTQISLVNQSIINYFTAELDLDGHLEKLHQFLLMEDGEFGEKLSELLFVKLSQHPHVHEVFNPAFLNSVLTQAVRSSMHREDKYIENLSFVLRYMPPLLKPNAPNVLDCLELTYRVPWPLNIVITDNSLSKYGRIFSFMLQLKHIIWVLKDVWLQLKRDALLMKAGASYQFRQLQLYRHEMQFFVKAVQEYLSNQIIHVSWHELRDELNSKITNLDDLHDCHGNYLNRCLSRCLLNKKAEAMMKIVQDIFGHILKFRMQLVSHTWQKDRDMGDITHPAFENMCATYNSFSNYSRFLFKVISIVASKSYQPHLQELLLRLNYNQHYSSDVLK